MKMMNLKDTLTTNSFNEVVARENRGLRPRKKKGKRDTCAEKQLTKRGN